MIMSFSILNFKFHKFTSNIKNEKMKKIFTVLMVLFVNFSYSQITVTDMDIMGVGDVVYLSEDFNANISLGNSGTNQTWDFSSLQPSYTEVFDIISPVGTPFYSSYPLSNICVDIDGDFLYFNKSNTGILALGQGDSVFQQPTMFMPLPLNYGDSHIDGPVTIMDSLIGGPTVNLLLVSQGLSATLLSMGAAQVADSINILVNMTNTFNVDAYGSVIMPNGTFNALRVQTSISTLSDVLVYCTDTLTGAGSGWYSTPFSTTTYEYGYYFMSDDPSVRFALVEISTDSALNIEAVSYLSEPPLSSNYDISSEINVYPVPTTYDLFIESTGSKILDKVELFDLGGRLILSSNSGSKIKLDISEVKKSIYILKVYSEGSFVQKKIVVQ